MRFVSWNVNGLRACIKKGFLDYFNDINADFFCLQEIKMSEGQLNLELEGYETFYNYAQRKGYSGTAIFTKYKPLGVKYGMGIEEHDTEGRLITLEYDDFFLVTCYTPNSKQELLRLDYRMIWEDNFRNYLIELNKKVLEEANEFIEDNSIEELGDLMEVINAIMKLKGYKMEEVYEVMKVKSNKKGAFNDKIYLEYVDEDKRNIE